MTVIIEECAKADVQHLFDGARRDGALTSRSYKSPLSYVGASISGKIVGFGSILHLSPKRARLSSLYVLPPFRGQGIGTSLLEFMMEKVASTSSVDVYTYQPKMYYKYRFSVVSRREIKKFGMTYYMKRRL